MELTVQARFTAPLAVLRLDGDLDLSTEDHVAWGVEQALVQGCVLISVDLGGVDFLDCAGLGALVAAARRVADAGGHLVVSGTRPRVAWLIAWTGTGCLLGLGQGGDPVAPVRSPGDWKPDRC